MMERVKCNLCGSRHYRPVYQLEDTSGKENFGTDEYKITEDSFGPVRIVKCLKCGLVFVNPQQPEELIFEKYRKMKDDCYALEEKGRRLSAKILLEGLSKFKKKGRILDIGCAAGFLLDEAKSIGWEPYGVELSEWASSIGRDRFGLNIFRGPLKDADFSHNYFDAVVMADSVEHLCDPKDTLIEVRRILKPNGILCIGTPDIDSLMSRLLKAKWWGIRRTHLYYFSKKTLAKMLDAAGFKVVECRPHLRVFSMNYWNKRLGEYHNFLTSMIRFFSGLPLFKGRMFRVNFRDQIEVYAQEKRCLVFIKDDEIRKSSPERKMKTVAVLPAYNAAKTLHLTVKDIPKDIVDDIILVDDHSCDHTAEIARQLGLKVFAHPKNRGYGGNQKTCYQRALELGAEIIVMVHPDYQYDPSIIAELIRPIQRGQADACFGSRMMKGGALEGGMPLWKHNANIILTAIENVVLGTYLSEYHSGFRAYSAKYLRAVNFMSNSDNFIFDNEIIVQGLLHYFKIEEIPIKTRYFDEASTIKFLPSVIYGFAILKTLIKYMLHTRGIIKFKQFEESSEKV